MRQACELSFDVCIPENYTHIVIPQEDDEYHIARLNQDWDTAAVDRYRQIAELERPDNPPKARLDVIPNLQNHQVVAGCL
jgi:hypothetical protein